MRLETTLEAAARLSIHDSTTRKLCREGLLPALKFGSQWIVNGTAADYLTVAQAADALGVSESCIRGYCQRDEIPGAVRAPFRLWLIPREALEGLS